MALSHLIHPHLAIKKNDVFTSLQSARIILLEQLKSKQITTSCWDVIQDTFRRADIDFFSSDIQTMYSFV